MLSSVLHFLVEVFCVGVLYITAPSFDGINLFGVFCMYNIFAFLLQPLTGYVVDKIQHKTWILLWAMTLFAISLLYSYVLVFMNVTDSLLTFYVLAILLGLGSAMFHVWGGRDTAVDSRNEITRLGLFVATGALGLAVGMVAYSWNVISLVLVLMVICSFLCVYRKKKSVPNMGIQIKIHGSRVLIIIMMTMICVAVMIRSLLRITLPTDMSSNAIAVMGLGMASMVGKYGGGWMARCFGIPITLLILMALSIVCVLCKGLNPIFVFLGLIAVNGTMPITLYLANKLMPRREGLAFGIVAASLIPGYLLHLFNSTMSIYVLCLVCIIPVPLILLVARFCRKNESRCEY